MKMFFRARHYQESGLLLNQYVQRLKYDFSPSSAEECLKIFLFDIMYAVWFTHHKLQLRGLEFAQETLSIDSEL